ncbi:hypothetical protein BHE74_00038966 [Ensete ventricosum]|nr:hypothetical protein BHE74_00038966 [Ensete ventricosum]
MQPFEGNEHRDVGKGVAQRSGHPGLAFRGMANPLRERRHEDKQARKNLTEVVERGEEATAGRELQPEQKIENSAKGKEMQLCSGFNKDVEGISREIDLRQSIKGEKGKKNKKKKRIHTSFPRVVLAYAPSPSSPAGDSTP